MNLVDPRAWLRAVRNPVVLTGLAVDLAPVYAVLVWGWGAAPLVMLYWIENLVAGVMTLPRLLISGLNFGVGGLVGGLMMSVFFVFHYGLFCLVHGTFLLGFISMSGDGGAGLNNAPMMDVLGMIRVSLQLGLHMDWMIGLVFGWQVFVLLYQFLLKGDWKRTNPMAEMFAPYGRIVILHIGIFAGAFALVALGDPMVGVLALILFRAAWGVYINAKDRNAQSMFGDLSGYDFAKALKGESQPTNEPDGRP